MSGWLFKVSDRGAMLRYAVWEPDKNRATRLLGKRLGLDALPEVLSDLSDTALQKFGAEPGRVACVNPDDASSRI